MTITATRYFQSIGRTCLSMVMSELLQRTLDRWMSSRAAFLANRLVWPDGNAGQTTSVTCGPNSGVLLAHYVPALSSWRTCQLSLPGMDPSLLESLPKWGMTQSGALYRLPTPERHTFENAGGVWPSPQKRDYRSGDTEDSPRMKRKMAQGWSPNLNDVVLWPTPQAQDMKSGTGYEHGDKKQTPQLRHISGGLLNPEWEEVLMGFPPGWTAVSDGPPDRTARIKALGNAVVVPVVYPLAVEIRRWLDDTP